MVSMNRLTTEKRAAILGCLVEGMSIRGTVRVTGAAKNTVTKLLVDVGEACSAYMAETLVDLPTKRVEADEIWSFVAAKEKNLTMAQKADPGVGDIWTWVAMDADTKLVISYLVADHSKHSGLRFISDLAGRLRDRIQLSTDGQGVYVHAVQRTFTEIDYGQIIKTYENDRGSGRYSPPVCTGIKRQTIMGDPEPGLISTSYIERQNLTMRMNMRRFTRLTNAFSKKIENHAAAVSLHFMHYNFARPHGTLSDPYPRTPAMATGVADHVWKLEEIARLLD